MVDSSAGDGRKGFAREADHATGRVRDDDRDRGSRDVRRDHGRDAGETRKCQVGRPEIGEIRVPSARREVARPGWARFGRPLHADPAQRRAGHPHRPGGLPRGKALVFAKINPLGGGEWQYKGPYGPWGAAIEREGTAASADLYVEPTQEETGRAFHVELKFADGQQVEFFVDGGRADPNLRMPGAALAAQWIGQPERGSRGARAGGRPGRIVRPQDRAPGLSKSVAIDSVTVTGPGHAMGDGHNPTGTTRPK